MNSKEIFGIALGLEPPWKIEGVEFKEKEENNIELHITIGFERGSKFKDPQGNLCHVHDTMDRSWQHLHFFQHKCFIHCKVPRIIHRDGKVRQVAVPWSRSGSGFTLLFEAFAMALIEGEMPVNKAARLLGIYPQRLWNIFGYWVSIAYSNDDPSGIRYLGIDETSAKKGHEYVTIAADLEAGRVIHVVGGKDKTTIHSIKTYLRRKHVEPEQIEQACMDMSPAYIGGVLEEFVKAQITFDKFHVIKLVNDAMDKVRKMERRQHELLKNHRYTFLKSNKNLSAQRKAEREELIELFPVLGEAYRLKELLNDFWDFTENEDASGFLAFWCDLAEESKIYPFVELARTIKSHWSGIINFIESKITNGVLEGINNKIQLAKRRARGYRNLNNFISMIYFICGKLKFDYPQYSI